MDLLDILSCLQAKAPMDHSLLRFTVKIKLDIFIQPVKLGFAPTQELRGTHLWLGPIPLRRASKGSLSFTPTHPSCHSPNPPKAQAVGGVGSDLAPPGMSFSGAGVGSRFMAFSPSPSALHSPHLSGLRSAAASSALLEQEKYLSELLEERHHLSPFTAVLPLTYRLLSQEILRVTTLLGNASVLGQSGLEHGSPLASGGLFSNGGADMNGCASRFQSEVRILTININFFSV
ncbi:KH domain-containing protein At5g56140-like [Neltuma alba]|uniref:KH domain-containing protein At5g56140-like n=1 Tax=Neltuma alba TaxID=207710 RepID=UPI0010A4D0D3|nr:KH domain-containing protein At5g56140-like [Prosopis alba]